MSSHGHEAVRINDVDFTRDNGEGDVEDVLRVVRRVVIDDASTGTVEPTFEQSGGLLSVGFNVGDVGHARALKRRAVVHHALQDKGGNAVVGPSVLERKALNNDKRELVVLGEVNSVLQRVIPLCAPSRCHPVHDDLSLVVGNAMNVEAAARNHDDPPRWSCSVLLVR